MDYRRVLTSGINSLCDAQCYFNADYIVISITYVVTSKLRYSIILPRNALARRQTLPAYRYEPGAGLK